MGFERERSFVKICNDVSGHVAKFISNRLATPVLALDFRM